MKTIAVLALTVLMACTSKAPEKKMVKYPDEAPDVNTTKPKQDMTAKQLASEEGSDLVTEVTFKEGSSIVNHDAQEKIKELYEKAKHREKPIDEVRLVTWADAEYAKKDLPEWQRKLASKRNDNLERALKGLDDDLDVKKISMAEKTKGLEEVAHPESAEVKESMEDVDESKTPRASKSIVMFILKK